MVGSSFSATEAQERQKSQSYILAPIDEMIVSLMCQEDK